MKKHWKLAAFVLFGMMIPALFAGKPSAASVPKIKIDEGTTIYLYERASQPEIMAAQELQRVFRIKHWRIWQGHNTIRFVKEFPKNGILIADMENPLIRPYLDKLNLKKGNEDQIAQMAVNGLLILAGNCAEAVYFSVMDFMNNQLGMKFLWPGDSGIFFEKDYTTVPGDFYKNYTPSFRYRYMSSGKTMEGAWFNIHNMMQCTSGVDVHQFGCEVLGGGETISPRRSDYKDHPEWFALRKGIRYLPPPEGWSWVINGCWSNQEFTDVCVKRILEHIEKQGWNHISIHPADDLGRCECDKCKALIQPDVSTRWYRYHAKIVRELKKTHPELHYSVLAYQEYRDVPAEKVEEVEFVEYCNYTRCFVHKIGNPNCGSNKHDFEVLNKWITSGKAPAMGLWDYTFDVFHPMYSLPVYSYLADLIKYCRDNKFVKIFFEGDHSHSRPAAWIAQQMLWDATLDEEKLLDRYCANAYGAAAKIMAKYHRACAAAWEAMPAHLSQCFNNPGGTAKLYLTPELQKLAEETFASTDACFAKDREAIEKLKAQKKPNKLQLERMETVLKQHLDAIAFEKNEYQRWLELHRKMMKGTLSMTIYKGTGDDDFGQTAVPFKEMKNRDGKVADNTTTELYWTDDALLARVTTMEPAKAPAFKKQHDTGMAFGTGCVELFVQPQGAAAYYHFCAERSGSFYEGEGFNGKWDCAWEPGFKELEGGWQITFKIPFKSLNVQPKNGDVWKIMVIRNDPIIGMPLPRHHDIGAAADITLSDGKRP